MMLVQVEPLQSIFIAGVQPVLWPFNFIWPVRHQRTGFKCATAKRIYNQNSMKFTTVALVASLGIVGTNCGGSLRSDASWDSWRG